MNNNGAFTLIEVILAIGVASIVLIAINAVFFTALHLRTATADAVDAAEPVDQALTIMRRDLQCAVPPQASGVLSGGFKIGNVTSTGISDPVSAEIYTADGALSANAPWGDIQRVTYELKDSTTATGKDLYRSVTRNLLTETTPDVKDQLMIRGVDSVQFSAYDGSQWDNSWDTTDTTSANTNLPVAVRVDIQLAGSVKDSSPIEIVVPIDSQSRTNSTGTVGS
ncbi:MAG TPA: type II secretion system protein GspJ [Verrucomicrobiae bacterium]